MNEVIIPMHYYKRNVGDYHRKAGRLTMLEHGAYTLLIDACYDREKFPTRDQAMIWCLARTPDEIAAVEFVLFTFFEPDQDGRYTQNHIVEDLEIYHGNKKRNKEIALEREEKRRKSRHGEHEACTDGDEACTNHHLTNKPLTNNHKPVNSKKPIRSKAGILLSDYLNECKSKGIKPISSDDPLFTYCEQAGIPDDYPALAWRVFKDAHLSKNKRYVDWKAAFRNAVKQDWYKLWAIDREGNFYLTTAGKQAEAAHFREQK